MVGDAYEAERWDASSERFSQYGPGDARDVGVPVPVTQARPAPVTRARPVPVAQPRPQPLPVVQARPVPAHAVPIWPLWVRLVVRMSALSWPFFWALARYAQQPADSSPGCVASCVSPRVAYAHGIFPWLFAYSALSLLVVNLGIVLLRRVRGRTGSPRDVPVPFIAKFAVFVTLCGVAFAIGILRGMSIWIYGR